MWQGRPTEPHRKETSSNPVFKNFNPFEILQPEKISTTNLLVDLTPDETSSLNPTSSTAHELSSLETLPLKDKKGFDAIDLFENILVTPALVNNKTTNEPNIDYEDFFNKLENDKCYRTKPEISTDVRLKGENSQTIRGLTSGTENSSYAKKLEIDSLFDQIVKNDRGKTKHATFNANREENPLQEDIIEEVLIDKTLEKLNITHRTPTENIGKVKLLSTPTIKSNVNDREVDKIKVNDIVHRKPEYNAFDLINNSERLHMKSLKNNDNVQMFTKEDAAILNNNAISKNVGQDKAKIQTVNFFRDFDHYPSSTANVTPSTSQSQANTISTKKTDYLALKSILENDKLNSDVKLTNQPVNRKFAIKELPINTDLLVKERQACMVKDAKHFVKYYVSSNDSDFNMTPGPTFEEKAVVLPILLKRLNDQKKEFEYKKNIQRRLILDGGCKSRNMVKESTINPTVLKEDCNKERLKAHEIGKKLEKLVKTGSYF